jgi:hypothetical protein
VPIFVGRVSDDYSLRDFTDRLRQATGHPSIEVIMDIGLISLIVGDEAIRSMSLLLNSCCHLQYVLADYQRDSRIAAQIAIIQKILGQNRVAGTSNAA